jgi:dihydrofolate reductase
MFENLNIKMIMAITREEVIGTTSGKLAWNCPEDFKFFKSMTTGKTLLMGEILIDL